MRNIIPARSKGKRPTLADVSAFTGLPVQAFQEARPSREARRLADLGFAPELASALALSVLGRDIIDRRDTKKGGR